MRRPRKEAHIQKIILWKQDQTLLLMNYPAFVKLFSYGERELNQKWPNYLSWMKISKILLLCTAFWATTVQAKTSDYPELNDEGEFSLMDSLSDLGWYDLQDERWNAYAQGTYIMPAFGRYDLVAGVVDILGRAQTR